MRPLADALRRVALPALVGLLLPLGGGAAAAQSPASIASTSVTIGSADAALALAFDDESGLAIRFADGEVTIDGTAVGTYRPDGALDAAWRALLATAVGVEGEALAALLLEWTPPEELPAEAADAARAVGRALDEALRRPTRAVPATDALRALLARGDDPAGALARLAEALRGAPLGTFEVVVGEDAEIGENERLDATLLVVGGDARIAGRVTGDVIVVDGTLRLPDGGRVEGDVRLAGSSLVRAGGRIDGEVIRVDPAEAQARAQLQAEVRDQVRGEIRAASRRAEQNRGNGVLRRAVGGIGGAVGQLLTVAVIALIGAAVVHFAPANLDAVAETARRTPGRALIVGTAGAFLVLPTFVLGVIVLAVSIIGIPALLLWVPLFPVAFVVVSGLGYLGAFRTIGVWVSRRRIRHLEWVRLSNPITLVAGGALMVALPSIAAELVSVIPWTGALVVALRIVAVVVSVAAGLVGFGAVLLTRAGRRPEFIDEDFLA